MIAFDILEEEKKRAESSVESVSRFHVSNPKRAIYNSLLASLRG